MDLLENGFYLEYMSWSCFDDGGLGHDAWLQKHRIRLKATTQKAAKEEAKIELAKTYSCNGSFCEASESGGKRTFIKLEKITTKIERSVTPLKLSRTR